MHRMYYPMTCEGGFLTVEYSLGIDFDWEPGQRGDRINPPIPAGPDDIQLASVSAAFGERVVYFPMDSEEFRVFEDMLDEDRPFFEKVQAACCEHIQAKREAAQDAAAEAKFQAMRDGE
jgi:hypothetical protein